MKRGAMGECKKLIAEIDAQFADLAAQIGRPALSPRVRSAMEAVPRDRFVPPARLAQAHENRPLPIGQGQTISQPFIVALMTELADVGPDDRVLEIGTGSGYQAAILARLAREVFSVEVIPELAEAARTRLANLGVANVSIRIGQGRDGWPDAAPFDAIVATCAATDLPPALIDQLAVGGRIVIPVGPPHGRQTLHRMVKRADGGLDDRVVLDVAFVPFV